MNNCSYRVAFTGVALLVSLAGSSALLAHHSPANFRFDTMLEFEGTVTSHEYRNPHIFVTIETATEAGGTQDWLLAGGSISNVRRIGWNADTFKVGDRITVRGNPDRNPEKKFLYIETITDTSGTAYHPRSEAPGGQRPLSEQTFTGSSDFTGVWQPDFSARDLSAGFTTAELPLTEQGQAIQGQFDEDDDPSLECIGDSLPMTLLPIYPVQFSRSGDELHIRYEQFDMQRVVHLGMTAHPAGTEPSYMGHSIGRIAGNVLTIDTAYFEPDSWGLGRGVPSGLQKHVTETYTLSEDGSVLNLVYTFEDPEYMTGSVTETGELLLNPGYEMEEWNCDPASARRHLSLD